MSFTWDVRIRFVDTDASGRIHYTAMFSYFEAAEFEFLRSRGGGYASFPEYSFPRVNVECDYMGATKCDDLLTITVDIAKEGTSSFTYAFDARCEGRRIAEGNITVVCLARETGRPTPLPEAFRKLIAD